MQLIGFHHLGLGGKISRKTKRKKTKSGLPISTFSKLFGRIGISKRLIIYNKRDLEYIRIEFKKSDIKYEISVLGGGGGSSIYIINIEKDFEVSTSFEMDSIHAGIEILIKKIGEEDRNKYCRLQYIGYDEDGYYDNNGNLCIAKKEVVERTFKENEEAKSNDKKRSTKECD